MYCLVNISKPADGKFPEYAYPNKEALKLNLNYSGRCLEKNVRIIDFTAVHYFEFVNSHLYHIYCCFFVTNILK